MVKCLIRLVFLFVLVLSSCKGGGNKTSDIEVPDSLYNESEPVLEVSDEAMENIVQNVASPVEMAALIKSMDIPFSNEFLSSTKDYDKYASASTKAFNLGIYGADLGYINIYSKQSAVLDYITAIKNLADGINVGQFFDFSTLKRLASNSDDIDSLMYISIHSFNKIDTYLRKNKRGNLSALMMTGVWVEANYLGTQVAIDVRDDKLLQTIGEQKTVLNQLLILLNVYKSDKLISDIIVEFKKLKKLYDEVKITIEVGDPEQVIKDGKLTIIQNERSIVHMEDELLDKIIKQSAEMRNKLIAIK